MAVRPIVLYPDPVLLRPTRPVEVVDDDVRKLVEDMRDTMYAAPGIGLAANQIGVGLRVFIVDLTAGDGDGDLHAFVNPVVREAEGSEIGEEGCLSFPDVLLDVPRHRLAGSFLHRPEAPHDLLAEGAQAIPLPLFIVRGIGQVVAERMRQRDVADAAVAEETDVLDPALDR